MVIYITMTPNNSTSSIDNEHRIELLWERREEQVVENFAEDANTRSISHDLKAKKFKRLNIGFTLPTIVIPLILSGLSEVLDEFKLLNNILLICVGILSGIQALLGFSEKYQKHSNFSNLFLELSDEVKTELSKPKSSRVACDLFMCKIRLRRSNLISRAPDL